MSEDFVRFEKRGHVAWVTLDRPEVMNALHPPCHDRLEAIWDEFRRLRSEGRTLVVTTQYVAEAEYCDQVALILDGELVALDAPEALRHMAFGGDVLEIRADRAVGPELLASVAGVENVRQPNPQTLIATVSDSAALTPRIVETMRAAGVGVAGIEEHQPTFDEVFTSLVERQRAARNGEVMNG